MALNLNISDFNAIASGKYNAGHITLSQNNKLDIVNNHVNMTFLNNKKVDAETILTLKNAFVDALRNSGIKEDALNDIRVQLGLKDAKSSSIALEPLSRQDVRAILDAYADDLMASGKLTKNDVKSATDLKAEATYKEDDGVLYTRQARYEETKSKRDKVATEVNDKTSARFAQEHRDLALKIENKGLGSLKVDDNFSVNQQRAAMICLLKQSSGTMSINEIVAEARKALQDQQSNLSVEINKLAQKLETQND